VVRRLITSLMLSACLLGTVQPAFACGPATDCCPRGSASGCIEQITVPAVPADDCCAAQPTLAASSCVVAQPRKSFDQAVAPPALFGPPADVPVAQSVLQVAPLFLTDYRADASLTYLHTARLRL
jgi:hypothetical protein